MQQVWCRRVGFGSQLMWLQLRGLADAGVPSRRWWLVKKALFWVVTQV